MGEPGGKERAEAWKTAIGLQAVDGLKTSEYLNETADTNKSQKKGKEEMCHIFLSAKTNSISMPTLLLFYFPKVVVILQE